MTAGTSYRIMELIRVAAQSFAGWTGEGGVHEEFQKTMGDLEHGC